MSFDDDDDFMNDDPASLYTSPPPSSKQTSETKSSAAYKKKHSSIIYDNNYDDDSDNDDDINDLINDDFGQKPSKRTNNNNLNLNYLSTKGTGVYNNNNNNNNNNAHILQMSSSFVQRFVTLMFLLFFIALITVINMNATDSSIDAVDIEYKKHSNNKTSSNTSSSSSWFGTSTTSSSLGSASSWLSGSSSSSSSNSNSNSWFSKISSSSSSSSNNNNNNALCKETCEKYVKKLEYNFISSSSSSSPSSSSSSPSSTMKVKNLFDTKVILKRILKEKENFLKKLQVDYGKEFFNELFITNNEQQTMTIGKTGFISPSIVDTNDEKKQSSVEFNISRKRFIRKMKLKILHTQKNYLNKINNVNNSNCDCSTYNLKEEVEEENKNVVVEDNNTDDNNNNNNNDNDSETTTTTDEKKNKQRRTMSLRKLQEEETNEDSEKDENDEKDDDDELLYYNRFVWTTGGHSASAGHGNFHNEAYTNVMENNILSIYHKSIGIEFEGRNYAMGGTSSGPEVALCQESIFGTDSDIISWDYGMTDGRAGWSEFLYGYRTSIHTNRPGFVVINGGNKRLGNIKDLESNGLPTLSLKDIDWWKYDSLVDTKNDISTTEERIKLPKYIQNLKCDGKIEQESPCKDYKYTAVSPGNRQCKVSGRVSWHPGWKNHAITGNIMSLFMIDLLIDSLYDIINKEEETEKTSSSSSSSSDSNSTRSRILLSEEKETETTTITSSSSPFSRDEYIKELQKVEDDDYKLLDEWQITKDTSQFGGILDPIKDIYEEKIVKTLQEQLPSSDENDKKNKKADVLSIIFKSKSLCHTAMLPAEIRYLGILTSSDDDNNDDGSSSDNKNNSTKTTKVMKELNTQTITKEFISNPNLFKESYDNGIEFNVAMSKAIPTKEEGNDYEEERMVIVQDTQKNYNEISKCPALVYIDYKDFFLGRSMITDDKKQLGNTITIPNKLEMNTYLTSTFGKEGKEEQHKLHGLIFITFMKCDWGRCPTGNLMQDEYNGIERGDKKKGTEDKKIDPKWKMTVNGIDVDELLWFNGMAMLVKKKVDNNNDNDNGNNEDDIYNNPYYWKPNNNGQYDIKTILFEDRTFVRISSFILF